MSFENNNERKVDQFTRPQEAQMSIAQQAWGPQARNEQHKHHSAREMADAQKQLTDGLSEESIRRAYRAFDHHSHVHEQETTIKPDHKAEKEDGTVGSHHKSAESASTEELIEALKKHDWAKQMVQYHQSQHHHAS